MSEENKQHLNPSDYGVADLTSIFDIHKRLNAVLKDIMVKKYHYIESGAYENFEIIGLVIQCIMVIPIVLNKFQFLINMTSTQLEISIVIYVIITLLFGVFSFIIGSAPAFYGHKDNKAIKIITKMKAPSTDFIIYIKKEKTTKEFSFDSRKWITKSGKILVDVIEKDINNLKITTNDWSDNMF